MIVDVVGALANVAAPAIAASVLTPITRTLDWIVAFSRVVENYVDLTRSPAGLIVVPVTGLDIPIAAALGRLA